MDPNLGAGVCVTHAKVVPCETTPKSRDDIADVGDVALFMRQFYARVARDDLLGDVFHRVAHVDWAEHMTKLTAFWSRVLFGTVGYTGDPFAAHKRVHDVEPFTPAHFERWLALFHDSLDRDWCGPNADRMKELAENVARVHSERLVGPTPNRSSEPAMPLREKDPMRTTLRIDKANCPNCFNETVEQLEHLDGVRAVHGSMADGSIEIDHDDVALEVMVGVVRDHLHGIEMFANEIRMVPVELSVTPSVCGHAS